MESDNQNKIRGSYFKTRKKMVSDIPKNFFNPIHENEGHFITYADAFERRPGMISIQYKVQGEAKQFRTPRWKTAFLDELGIDRAKVLVEDWKRANNNSTGRGKLLPNFYHKHRKQYLKWLANTAKPTTIAGYEASLEAIIFPYFVERLGLTTPKQWDQNAVSRWDAFLSEHIPESSSRNRKRTALNRYLRFLFHKGIIKKIPTLIFEPTKRLTKETVIPGELPTWESVLVWLKSLPPGRYRFVRAVTMGFGLRISEALAVTRDDFVGDDFKDDLIAQNNFIARLIEKDLASLVLSVDKAKKRKINPEILRLLGCGINEAPKSGAYTACCTNEDIAEFIVEMIGNDEDLEPLTMEQVYKIKDLAAIDRSPHEFHKYNPHDDRRLNITLQCLDLSMEMNDVVEVCCQLHGQSSREVFNRYFQWGQMQRRIQKHGKSGPLKVIKRAK